MIDYKDNEEIRPLCIFFLEISVKDVKDILIKLNVYIFDKRWKKVDNYMTIWEKISNIT